jgi:hypothetical protein
MGVIRAFFEGEKDLPKIVIKISELQFFISQMLRSNSRAHCNHCEIRVDMNA